MEQVVEVTTGSPSSSSLSEVIDLTNGFELPPSKAHFPSPSSSSSSSSSLSSLLFSSGSRATETLLRSSTSATNALLGTSSTIPSSISSPSSAASSLADGGLADKGLIYAPSFPNYIVDNVTLKGLPRQIYQWTHSQYVLNGTSGSIDWDSGLRNSLYSEGDDDDSLISQAGGVGQDTTAMVGTCDDVYVSENGMAYQVTVYCMYIGIFVLALLGNGVVCYIVQSSPRMRTVTNYFICNLAIGDILMSLFCVPFSFISILILGYWPFGVILCHLVNYSQAISVLVSAYTLVAISVDRYIVIMWPLRPRITKR